MTIDLANPGHVRLARRAASRVIASQFASESALQRQFSISRDRAHELLLLLEERGIVGPAGLGVSREVLVRSEQRHQVIDAEFPLPQGGTES